MDQQGCYVTIPTLLDDDSLEVNFGGISQHVEFGLQQRRRCTPRLSPRQKVLKKGPLRRQPRTRVRSGMSIRAPVVQGFLVRCHMTLGTCRIPSKAAVSLDAPPASAFNCV